MRWPIFTVSQGKTSQKIFLQNLKRFDVCARKETFLPQQGDCLHEIGKLLRILHRSSSKDAALSHKEEIKQQIRDIRQKQSAASDDNHFTMKVISLFQHPEETKIFAIRWVQLELDAISRACLPQLQNMRNEKWNELSKACNENKQALVQKLEDEVSTAEKNIAAAACGWETSNERSGANFMKCQRN